MGISWFNSPGQSTHKPPYLAAASASSISRPGGTVGWLWNLRSEWTTWRSPYPSCTRGLSSPTTIGFDRTLPDVRSRCTTRNGGPKPAKRATNPRAVPPQRDPPARKVPRSGPTSQPKGRLNPLDSDRLPPKQPGSQSDAAAARRIGAGGGRREYRECAGNPWDRSRTWTSRRGNRLSRHHSHDSDSTPKAYRLGLETTTRPVGCFRSTPTGTTHCMEQRLGKVQDPGGAYSTPRLLLLGDTPAREVPSWIRH
jgi:hypothetical protein